METLNAEMEEKLNIHPDSMKVKEKIKILVMEDSEFYNAFITRQIKLVLDSIGYFHDLEFELIPYMDVNYCVSDIKSNRFNGAMTIAFLDYYLSQGLNGLKLSKMIKSISKRNKVVLFTQSDDFNLWKKLRSSQALACLHKHEFTTSKCRDILEKILLKGKYS